MEQSILKSTKKILGLEPDDESFDLDVITHINSAFSVLHDLGIGPEDGFAIEDETVAWSAYLPNDLPNDRVKLGQVRVSVFLRAKLLFDPPGQSFLIEAIQKQIEEAEWRLNVNRETTDWVDPTPPVIEEEEVAGGFGL